MESARIAADDAAVGNPLRSVSPETPTDAPPGRTDLDTYSPLRRQFFAFICASTVCRAFEAGVVSSMMPQIARTLHLDYTAEGGIASAPDYGIVPAGLVAMLVFERFAPRTVLGVGNLLTCLVCALAALYPSYAALVTARALGGLCWGCAAVHYPAWINARAAPEARAMWLALVNVCLLGGILVGFAVGGSLAAFAPRTPWTLLYGVEALLMGLAGLAVLWFPAALATLPGSSAEGAPLLGGARAPARPARAKFRAVVATPLVRWTVGAGSFVCGTVGFLLYFIAQVAAREAPGWSAAAQYAAISAVFVAAPIPGNLWGARVVTRMGGYERFEAAHAFTAKCAFGGVVCIALMFLPTLLVKWPAPFCLLCWGFLFCGAAPTPVINGVVLAAAPSDAAFFASGLQFAVQNLVKLLLPIFGGMVIDRVGLLLGFDAVLLFSSGGYFLCALGARSAAKRHVRLEPPGAVAEPPLLDVSKP